MKAKSILLGGLAYLLVTFPLAVVWHIVLFEATYVELGYFTGEPSFLLGFLAILSQGLLLSAGFGLVRLEGSPTVRGLKFALLTGVFFWTSHVLAYAAKNPASAQPLFFLMETPYLGLQFGLYGLLIGRIYGKGD